MSDPILPPAGDPIPPPPGAPVGQPALPPYAGQPFVPLPPGTPVTPENGLGTAALIMGILQFFCLGPIGSILAIIFGRMGMNRAKQGRATNGGVAVAGFWLGIAGLILSVIGIIIAVFAIGFGVKVANDSLDPAHNTGTGLADGSYVMNPNTSLHLNDRCSFGGTPVNMATSLAQTSAVTVVGEGDVQCGSGSGTPNTVFFTVSGGIARITGVQ